ncbi:MAG: DUF4307 domain-containing protein [Actinomycetota bacterium]|uniref:DUF4307 domain-containing protein n=1 Tax=Paenarthrobacter sp. PH39-S1 TaxID=3046204 RepID=UPI0024BBB019|nr:DUF4307 domain-containing protein [Paenarthrobacter sp. PH39-S1]MDJ0354746.1 DUF4307 domain-containing protein [Paenarthrobacter sp. PH39-S1]MDQ6739776.1 DUF4307 domain-containing protein [Actinomycetota bacterium]
MSVSDSSAATSVATRYGTPKRVVPRRQKILLTTVIAVLALVFVAWLALGRGEAPVTSKDIGFSVQDGTMTQVDFQVVKNPGDTAQCAVKALGSSFAIVGWDVVTIGPNAADSGTDQGRTTAQRAWVRTESPAVSGVVDSCWIVTAK